jgi:hypothetical protein
MKNILTIFILIASILSFGQENNMQIRLPNNTQYDFIGTTDGFDKNDKIELYECMVNDKSFGYVRVNRKGYPVTLLKSFNEYGGGDLYVYNLKIDAYEKKGQLRKHNERFAIYYLSEEMEWIENFESEAANIFDALLQANFMFFTNLKL